MVVGSLVPHWKMTKQMCGINTHADLKGQLIMVVGFGGQGIDEPWAKGLSKPT